MGGDILTFPADTPTTQGLSLWCFNIVGGEILHLFPDTPTKLKLSRVIPMVFQHSGGEILKPSPDTPTTLKGYRLSLHGVSTA